MADRALLATGGANAAAFVGPRTKILNDGIGHDVASRSLCVIDPSDGKRYNASRSQTYEGCIFDGLSGGDDCDISETLTSQQFLYVDKGFGTLIKVGKYASTGAAAADGAMLLYGSSTSDAIVVLDTGKIVYALDGQTLAVADAATAANRPHRNAVAVGRIHQVEVAGSSARATVLLFTQKEAADAGWYMPTGSPLLGINPMQGVLGQAAIRQWVELFSKLPNTNAIRAPTIASVGAIDEALAIALATNDLFELSGTAASTADVTHALTGGMEMQTDNSDGDQLLLFPHQDTGASILKAGLSSSQQCYYGLIFKQKTAVTNRRIKVGLVKTAAHDLTTDADQFGFSYGTDSSDAFGTTNWHAFESASGTDTKTTTSIAADTSIIRLECSLKTDRKPQFWVNGVVKATGLTTALASGVALEPYIGIEAGSTNEPIQVVYAVWCGALSS